MTITTAEELEGMRRAGREAARILLQMLEAARVGMSTGELNALGEQLMADIGAVSAPKIAVGFPEATCISVNEEVAHGIPGAYQLQRGDVLNVDVSLALDGYFADNGATIVMEGGSHAMQRLCDDARAARDQAIAMVRHGARFSVVGRVIEEHARRGGYKVVKNLCSHGIGRALHEEPGDVLGYFDRRERRLFTEGMVLTVEPFLSTKGSWAEEGADGWTLLNMPGGRSAQFEHTLMVRRDAPPEIFTVYQA